MNILQQQHLEIALIQKLERHPRDRQSPEMCRWWMTPEKKKHLSQKQRDW